MTITANQIHVAARGLYALHLAQNDSAGHYIDLSDFARGMYYAKAERMLYDLAHSDCRLGPKALEEVFND